MPIAERPDLFTQVCQAVQHAHQKGIIHRDIKPTNVLVTSLDGVPLPRVIDFGIAKATGQSLTDKTLFTGFAQLIGTPLYMSPEQAELSAVDIDTRSDIYSLGVLLYELLTGTTPFDQDTFRTAALDEVRRIIREDEPPKPSTRLSGLGTTLPTVTDNRQTDARKLNRSLRGELDWIVMKALEKDRRRRYETAGGLARDVGRYLAGDPVEAGPPSGWYRLRKFARRNRVVLTTTVLVVLALTAGATVSIWQAILARRAQADATSQRDEARQAVDDMYTDVAEQWLRQKAALEPMQRKFLQKALDYYRRFAGETSIDPKVRLKTAQAYHRVGIMQEKLGSYSEAEAAYRRAMAQLQQLVAGQPFVPEHQSELATILGHLGDLLRQLDQNAEAEELIRGAIALHEKLASDSSRVPQHRSAVAFNQIYLAILLGKVGRLGESEHSYRRAIELLEKLVADSPSMPEYRLRLANSHNGLGTRLDDIGSLVEAEHEYRRAIVLLEKLAADEPSVPEYRSNLIAIYGNLGGLLMVTGRRKEAEQVYRRAITLGEKTAADSPSVPEYSSDLAWSYNGLAAVLITDRPAEAAQAFRRSVDLYTRLAADSSSAPEHLSDLAMSYGNLGVALKKTAHYKEAEQVYHQAITLHEKLASGAPSVPRYRSDLAGCYDNLGNLLRISGRAADAERALRQAVALFEKLASDSPSARDYESGLANSNAHLAILLLAAGRGAEQAFRRAVAQAENLTDPEVQNELSWALSTGSNRGLRNSQLAVKLAKKAVDQEPQVGDYWNTLGVAHYRVRDWAATIESLGKSMQLRAGGDPSDWYFLAMAHWRMGDKDQARQWYDNAVNAMEKNKSQDEELRRFRAEAAALLGVTEHPKSTGKEEDDTRKRKKS
jgi:serine/threonine protein kinase/Flp pilus assembly protein TadD